MKSPSSVRSLAVVVVLFVQACGPGVVTAEGEGEGEAAEGEGEAGEGEGEAGEGEGEGEAIDVGPPPSGFSTTPPASSTGDTCSTAQWWSRGDRESELMHPGGDCIQCHTSRGEGPRFSVAGTVFQDLTDGDDCRGIPSARIEILDTSGAVALSMDANAAGNFFATARLPAGGYTARVTYDGRTTSMTTTQTDGACNHCHTVDGLQNAPGRILVP